MPRPATPHRMQGVQRYPALFVAAPGPFWRGHGPGVQGYQVGRSGVGGRVLKGSRTGYLWCRGTPGQRRARSRCWCRYVRRPNSWALPHGQDGQQPRTEFDRKANPEMRNRQHDLSLSHDAGTDLVGTAVPEWAISCCGSGVEGGGAVSVVSRNPRSETDARLVARFGAKRTVAHGLGRYGRRPNSGALLSEGRSNRKHNSIGKETPK